VPAEPAAQPTGNVAAHRGFFTQHATENSTSSPAGSNSEEFYDAVEAVPRGVRAAVQMFEVCC
jgi:hypothetical protein